MLNIHFNEHFLIKSNIFIPKKVINLYISYKLGPQLRNDGSIGKNLVIFGVHMSSSVHIDNKEKDILILGKGPTQGSDGNRFTVEALHPINFIQSGERFVLSLHYNGSNSVFLLMLQKYINSK